MISTSIKRYLFTCEITCRSGVMHKDIKSTVSSKIYIDQGGS